MKVETKELITAKQYSEDTGKSHQLINRYLCAERPLPGIQEYYELTGLGYVLKKGSDYRNIVAKIKKQKYLVVLK